MYVDHVLNTLYIDLSYEIVKTYINFKILLCQLFNSSTTWRKMTGQMFIRWNKKDNKNNSYCKYELINDKYKILIKHKYYWLTWHFLNKKSSNFENKYHVLSFTNIIDTYSCICTKRKKNNREGTNITDIPDFHNSATHSYSRWKTRK